MALALVPFPALNCVTKIFGTLATHHDRRGSALDASVEQPVDTAPQLPAGPACGYLAERRVFAVHGIATVRKAESQAE